MFYEDFDNKLVSSIGKGLMVLIGVTQTDTEADAEFIAQKIVNARIFTDSEDKMNLSLQDINGEVLLVSQFTLYGDIRKGRRPSFIEAARPEQAEELYEKYNLSMRAVSRIQKVARTIADLAGEEQIAPAHIAEAITYRSLDRESWGR